MFYFWTTLSVIFVTVAALQLSVGHHWWFIADMTLSFVYGVLAHQQARLDRYESGKQ